MQRTEGPWGSRQGTCPPQPEDLQLPSSQSALAFPPAPERSPRLQGRGDTPSFPEKTWPPHGGISRLREIPQLVQGHPGCVCWGEGRTGVTDQVPMDSRVLSRVPTSARFVDRRQAGRGGVLPRLRLTATLPTSASVEAPPHPGGQRGLQAPTLAQPDRPHWQTPPRRALWLRGKLKGSERTSAVDGLPFSVLMNGCRALKPQHRSLLPGPVGESRASAFRRPCLPALARSLPAGLLHQGPGHHGSNDAHPGVHPTLAPDATNPPAPHLGTALGRASPSSSAQPTPPGLGAARPCLEPGRARWGQRLLQSLT